MKRVLVAGGAGFIGAHLCRALLKKGFEVCCLDNLSSGSRANIADLMGKDGFSFLETDVADTPDMEGDAIFHLACPASPVWYRKDPIQTLRTCFQGSLRLLELARKNDARILFTSTSEVYGEPIVHPQPESYWGNVNPDGERACYDEGKRVAETLFFEFHRLYGTQIRVVRVFNTYGPGMQKDDGRVVSNFIVQALEGKPLTIYGDGTQTRSFCYVSDMVEGILRMMEQEHYIGPVNLGNPNEFTIKELAEKVITKTGAGSELVQRPLPSDDPTRRQPDIELAKETLQWEPKVMLDEGLDRTIEWFARTLHA